MSRKGKSAAASAPSRGGGPAKAATSSLPHAATVAGSANPVGAAPSGSGASAPATSSQLSASSMAALLLEALKATDQPLSLFAKKLSIMVSRGVGKIAADDTNSTSAHSSNRQTRVQQPAVVRSADALSPAVEASASLPQLLGSLICFLITNGLLSRLQTLMGVWVLCDKFGGARGPFGLDLIDFLDSSCEDAALESESPLLPADQALCLEWLEGGQSLEKYCHMSIENAVAQFKQSAALEDNPKQLRESILTSPRAAHAQITLIPALDSDKNDNDTTRSVVSPSFLEACIDELRPQVAASEGWQTFELQQMADFACPSPPIFELESTRFSSPIDSSSSHSASRLSRDVHWLSAASVESPFMFDKSLVEEMSASLLKRRFFEAARQMLVPDDVAYIITRIEDGDVTEEEFSPNNVSVTFTFNPSIVLSFYKWYLRNRRTATESAGPSDPYISAICNLPLTVASIELINILLAEASLANDIVVRFANNSVRSVENTSDKYLQARLVRLLSVFIIAQIRNRVVPLDSELAKNILPAFCKAFFKIKEVAVLDKLLK